MKNKFLVIVLLICGINFAQVDRSVRPKPGPAPEIKLGKYDSFTLKNGLKVFVVENHKLPRVAFNLVVDRSPILEGDSAGYIEAAGELLRTGTKNRTKDKIDEEIDFIGATLNTSSTGIYAASLKKHVNKLLDIMSDILLHPLFRQEELDKIKKQMLSSLASAKDNPDAISTRVRDALFYGKNHPYGESMTEESVNKINLQMCNKYYETYFKPNISYLAIVGDINKAEAQKLVEKYFGKWKKGNVSVSTFPTPKPPLVNKVELVDRSNSVQSVITIGYPIELPKSSEDVIPASVMNTILGGSFLSRINNNLREKHGYTYGAGSSINSDQYVGSFYVHTKVRNAVTDSAITEIFNELRRIRNEKVKEDELQTTKNYMTGSFARSLENPQTIANFAINIARYKLPQDYYKNYLKNLNAVTVDDIASVAKKYIKPNNCNIIVVGNGEEIVDGLKKFSLSGKVDYYDIYGNKYDPSLNKIPEGVTAQSILNKYIEAIGGKDNLLKIKDKTTKLSGSIQGMNLTLTMYQKLPNKLYQVLDAGVFKQETIFNGKKGKVVGMGQTIEMTPQQIEKMKAESSMHWYLDIDSLGVKMELSGMENINGKNAYKVTFTTADGSKIVRYFDTDTGFLIREVNTVDTPQGSFTQTLDFGDYREVQGVKYPFKLSQNLGPNTIDLTVSSIEVNTGLKDDLFEVK
ncbi:M16 family metallopeptidase [Melioribacteraceae bacterium 4301-Me]|uniref:M16 family metallopeptidase n=1 Tax=Pyranulibacter aquaticus TaxID=3163344 RepID=UPI003598CDEF